MQVHAYKSTNSKKKSIANSTKNENDRSIVHTVEYQGSLSRYLKNELCTQQGERNV